MLYNKNQYRKTNDKKVLHKIGKHWVTVSVAFLSLLGLGAVSTTTKADSTVQAQSKTAVTSAMPQQSGKGSAQQVQQQANLMHKSLMQNQAQKVQGSVQKTPNQPNRSGQATPVKPASTKAMNDNGSAGVKGSQGQSVQPSSANKSTNVGSVKQAPSSKASISSNANYGSAYKPSQTNSTSSASQESAVKATSESAGSKVAPASKKVSGSATATPKASSNKPVKHLLGGGNPVEPNKNAKPVAKNNVTQKPMLKSGKLESTSTQTSMVDPVHPDTPVHQLTALSGSYNGVNYNVYSDEMTPENTTNKSKWIVPANASDWAKTPKADRSDSYGTYTYLTKDNYKTTRLNKFNKFKSKYFNPNSSSYGKATVKTTYSAPKYNDYQIEFTSGSISNMYNFMSNVTKKKSFSNNDIVGITFDKGINTSKLKNMQGAFSNVTNLRYITGLDNINTSNVINVSHMLQSDTKLGAGNSVLNQIHQWKFVKQPKFYRMLRNTGDLGLDNRASITKDASYSINFTNELHSDTYDGLNYTYNSNTNNMKFTGGTLSYPVYRNATYPEDTKQSGIVGAFSQPGEEAPRVNQQIINDFNNVRNISFGSDVSLGNNTTNLMGMFYSIPKLQSVDMSNIKPDSNNIKNMSYMFSNDPSLTSVKLPKEIDLTHVTDMNNMFSSDPNLSDINLGNSFEHVGNAPSDHGVTMDSMFSDAGNGNLSVYDANGNSILSATNPSDGNHSNKFDTSNVTSMASMFKKASFALSQLQLPDSFNTHKVTNMSNMFNGTRIAHSDETSDNLVLDLGKNFSTSDVTNMSGMFANENDLPALDISSKLVYSTGHQDRVGFNTSKVTDMSDMFQNDHNLRYINFPITTNKNQGFNTSHVTNMNSMFESDANYGNVSLNLTLPKYFYVNGSSKDMFKNAVFNSLTLLPSGQVDPSTKDQLTNTKFDNKTTGIGALYQVKVPNGQFKADQEGNYLTMDTPASFKNGIAGSFTNKVNVPATLAYSDAFSDIDGHLGWRLAKSQVPINKNNPVVIDNHGNGLKGDWAFLSKSDYPTSDYSDIQTVNGRAKVVPLYHGLETKFDKAKNSVEFIYGTISDQNLNGFDDPNKPSDQVTPEDGHYTIAYAVKHANTLTFDGWDQNGPSDPNAGAVGTIISDIPDMSYMFANPNLKHINFNGVFDTNNTSNMAGMFQGAQISDLSLPGPVSDYRKSSDDSDHSVGFNMSDSDLAQNADAQKNMFAMPKLRKLTLNTPLTMNYYLSDTGLPPTWYKVTSKTKDGREITTGKGITFNTYFSSTALDGTREQGTYLTSDHSVPLSVTIDLNYTNGKGKTTTVKSIPVNTFAGSQYTVYSSDDSVHNYFNDPDKSIYGYELTPKDSTYASPKNYTTGKLYTNNQTIPVSVEPIVNSTYVQYMYGNKKVGSDTTSDGDTTNSDFKGTLFSNTTINSKNASQLLPLGYKLTSNYHGTVSVPHENNNEDNPYKITVTPIPATVTIHYIDQSDGNKVVGHTVLTGNDYDSKVDKYETNITSTNDAGLSSDYNLVTPDNYIKYYTRTVTIPVKHAYSTSEPINYDYGKDIVGTSTATSFTGTAKSKSANVMAGMPGGYHLVSGASSTIADTGHTSSVAVTPNTITENISYAVQNDPRFSTANDSFSGFASVINDERTSQYGNTSFEITNNNQANTIPNGYRLVSDYKVGPVATNSASSSANHTLQIVPEWEGIHVLFEDPDYNVLGEFADSGFAGNSLSKPIADAYPADFKLPHVDQILSGKENSEWAYLRNSDLPTKFVPGYGDETIRIVEHPIYATDTINYVDETNNNNKVDSATITGIKNVPNPTINITNSYKPGLSNNYVLANNSTTVTYNGKSYDVPVVPNNNVFTVNYQYNGQTVGTQAFSGKKPTDKLNINNGNEKGLPAGYSLVDQHNAYGNKFIYADKSGNVAIQPNQVSDTINFMNGNQKIGSITVSGNDYRATAAGDNQAEIDNDTHGVPSNYYVVNNPVAVNYDGGTHNVNVAPDKDVDTVNYQYNNSTVASYQFEAAQGSHINITNSNQPDMPDGYHLVSNNNQFTVNSGNHNVQITPDTMTFTVTFTSKGKPVATKTYQGATDSKFKVNSATDTPRGYTINGNQNVNFKFDGDKANDNASLAVTPIPPKYATETINFLYTNDARGKVFSEGATKKSSLQGNQGTIMSSDYTNINPGYQVIPDENKFNKGSKYTFDNGSVDIYVEPISQTDTIWYVNDQTGKLIANDGPFTDTITKTGNDSRASDADNTSFTIGANPSDLRTDYYRVDNPGQLIPFDGQKHVVSVHLIKQAPYSAKASEAAKANQASTAKSISNQASSIAKEQNSKVASSYASSASSEASSSMASSATNSVASTNDSSEYNHEQSSNSSVASSESKSASQSESTANSSSNKSISSQVTSHSTNSVAPRSSNISSSASSASSSTSSSVAPSSAVAPNSSAVIEPIYSSEASSSVQPSSSSQAMPSSSDEISYRSVAPVTLTNKNYPISYSHNLNKPDMVTYMGRQYPVHYHANGKNTINARQRINQQGHHYNRMRNVVVSTDLPITHPSSDRVVRLVDYINFNHVSKHIWTRKGLNKVLNTARPNKVISYYGTKMAVINEPSHWRYFMVTKNALAHMMITKVGRTTTKDLLKAHHARTIFIKRIVAVHGHKHNFIRYEFSVHHHNFWVTGRKDYVPNAYWQKNDFSKHHAHYVRVIRACRLYKRAKYGKKTFLKNIKRGKLVHVAKVININKPSYEQTRLVLTNGRFITANKNYVKIVK